MTSLLEFGLHGVGINPSGKGTKTRWNPSEWGGMKRAVFYISLLNPQLMIEEVVWLAQLAMLPDDRRRDPRKVAGSGEFRKMVLEPIEKLKATAPALELLAIQGLDTAEDQVDVPPSDNPEELAASLGSVQELATFMTSLADRIQALEDWRLRNEDPGPDSE